MKNRHDRYFELLEAVAASMEPTNGFRIASCIVLDRHVISIGMCRRKTHPMQKKYGKNILAIELHAEIDAITQALRKTSIDDLGRSTLYVLRLKKPDRNSKSLIRSMAKPCKNGCERAIKAFGINRVFYTTDDGYEEM